jgi:3-phosphoshikimate 1-carboxyvinyltransferase
MVSGSVLVRPADRVRATLRVPGDKSIAHRYALLAALAEGRSVIHGFAPGADCRSTLSCLEALGIEQTRQGTTVTLIGRGARGFRSPQGNVDAGNSGTTTRLLSGILAAQPLSVTITGDESLSRRPMARVIAPLTRMGARIEATNGRLPMTIHGGNLEGIAYRTEVPSAQVKSAVLLAGLLAGGTTCVTEAAQTRNHTELALRRFGAAVETQGLPDGGATAAVLGGQRLSSAELAVPGDMSSATFWCLAAAGLPGSQVRITDVGLNPTRTALLGVLERAGATVTAEVASGAEDEPAGTLTVGHAALRPIAILPAEVPGLIDELPGLAALATFGGEITVTGAGELRVKESDRITALVTGLRALGADADELPDGFHVIGRRHLEGGIADAVGDHRLAMAFAVAALGARRPSTILGAGAVDVSYPGFFDVLESVRA